MSAIFISYRREDAEDSARALYESLLREFGKDRLFIDVEDIAYGSDFREAVEKKLDDCGVFLAVIGPTWLDAKDPNDPAARRRLDNPGDFVRQEVGTALKRKSLPVIPVLVRGATMPPPDRLSEDLHDLAYRNALTLSHAVGWEDNVNKLVRQIRPLVGEGKVEHPAGAAVSATGAPPRTVQRAAPAPTAADSTTPGGGLNKGLMIGIPALIVALAIGYFVVKHSHKPERKPDVQPINSGITLPDRSGEGQTKPENAGRTQASGVAVTIAKNKRLTNVSGPVDVLIDGEQQGQIRFDANGSTPIQIHAKEGKHQFALLNPQTKASCTGTFNVNPGTPTLILRMKDNGTVCSLEVPNGQE